MWRRPSAVFDPHIETSMLQPQQQDHPDRQALIRGVLEEMSAFLKLCHRTTRAPSELDIFELTMPQCRAVLSLNNGPLTMSKLAAGLGISLPSCTGVVDKLVERGLVSRAEDPEDRRVVRCVLTNHGYEMASSLFDADLAVMEEFVSVMSDDELGTILDAMAIMRRAASNLTPQDAPPPL